MPRSGVAEARGNRSQHDERKAALDAARAALLEWDARERELERLPSAVRALDDWSTSEHEPWSSSQHERRSSSEHERRSSAAHEPVAATEWSPSASSGGVAGRRTVTIRGQVADRYVSPHPSSRRRPERRYERSGFRPDRAALWAFVLGLMLILAAVTSAHAATLHAAAHLH
jgi:hypothetical protein